MQLFERLVLDIIRKLSPCCAVRRIGVTVGKNCRILCGLDSFGSEPYLITLGNHVTITSGVQFITHDGGVWVFREDHPDIDLFGAIRIGNNVFIGVRTIILPGVAVGDNCIIGAGSVLVHNVPPNSVVAGNPARYICEKSEYFERHSDYFTHIRSWNSRKKRAYLLSHDTRLFRKTKTVRLP
jgi:acetyltransferase-like isoleucine patch superfamily enzyme